MHMSLMSLRPAVVSEAFTRARFARTASTAVARAARASAPAHPAAVRPAPFASARVHKFTPGGVSRNRFVRCRAIATSVASSSEVSPGANHADLPKNFEQGDVEERLYKMWEDNGYFKPSELATGEPFTIAMPPPNVTGALHMGHAMFVTIQDIMARNARMRGRPTLWLPGTDHAGIATQLVVERSLEAEGLTREGVGKFILMIVWAISLTSFF
jgi:valyl-tRNA synthetase